MTSLPKSQIHAPPFRRIPPRVSITFVIQAALGAVFLIAAYAKALDSADVVRAVESTFEGSIPSGMLVGALVAFEAALGASLVFMRRSIAPLALAAATLAAFSAWLVWADRALPSLSCGCFGSSGAFGRDLTLGESLTRNGLLLFAALVLIVQRIVHNCRTLTRTTNGD